MGMQIIFGGGEGGGGPVLKHLCVASRTCVLN